ncbi:MAG: hypothetical protein KDC92_14765 [Bacteroidetes bacterium]|nr:hypothetical protein [Bacteroidota bacterium]
MLIPKKLRSQYQILLAIQLIGTLVVVYRLILDMFNSGFSGYLIPGMLISTFSLFAVVMGFQAKRDSFKLLVWCQILQLFFVAIGPLRWAIFLAPNLLVGAGVIDTGITFTLFDFQFNPAYLCSLEGGKGVVMFKLNVIPFIFIHFTQVIRNRAIDVHNAGLKS